MQMMILRMMGMCTEITEYVEFFVVNLHVPIPCFHAAFIYSTFPTFRSFRYHDMPAAHGSSFPNVYSTSFSSPHSGT